MCLKLVKTSVLQKHTGCNNRLLVCSLTFCTQSQSRLFQERSVSTKDAHSILEFKVNLWLFTLARDRFVELKNLADIYSLPFLARAYVKSTLCDIMRTKACSSYFGLSKFFQKRLPDLLSINLLLEAGFLVTSLVLIICNDS